MTPRASETERRVCERRERESESERVCVCVREREESACERRVRERERRERKTKKETAKELATLPCNAHALTFGTHSTSVPKIELKCRMT